MKKYKLALPTTPKKRVAILASILENKKSPTVKSLEKLQVVVSPEERDDLQLDSAVIMTYKVLLIKQNITGPILPEQL